MIEVKFYPADEIDDSLFKFAVIVSKYSGKWIWVKNKTRKKWEIPGGHREINENICDTAKRELYEETGAAEFNLSQVCAYSVKRDSEAESFGMLFFAEIIELGIRPECEIEYMHFFDEDPSDLSFPEIQPKLLDYVKEWIKREYNQQDAL